MIWLFIFLSDFASFFQLFNHFETFEEAMYQAERVQFVPCKKKKNFFIFTMKGQKFCILTNTVSFPSFFRLSPPWPKTDQLFFLSSISFCANKKEVSLSDLCLTVFSQSFIQYLWIFYITSSVKQKNKQKTPLIYIVQEELASLMVM